MLVVYDSMTGNVERFIKKLGHDKCIKIEEGLKVNEPFVLITYTIFFGQTPKKTGDFLEDNSEHLLAVASSGDQNWGMAFAKAADNISEKYNVPILHKFQKAGTEKDMAKIKKGLEELSEIL